AAPVEVRVHSLDGQTVAGQLSAIADGKLTLLIAERPRTIALAELQAVSLPGAGRPSAGTPGAWVTLTDGSLLVAQSFAAKDGKAQILLRAGGKIEVPVRALDTVRYREHTGQLAEQWGEVLKADRSEDLIVVRKNDNIDSIAGVIRAAADEEIQFEL